MGLMYDRTVSISRPAPITGHGSLGYGGRSDTAETPIFSGIKASIQSRQSGRPPPTGLPADTPLAIWNVYLNRDALCPAGSIKRHDIVRDDLGRRFEVTQDYCNFMGWRLTCDRLEA
jgi:hypothetical protein